MMVEEEPFDGCYVYLIAHTCDRGLCKPVKVGVSKTPEKRLKMLQTGNPSQLKIGFAFLTPDYTEARNMETAFHKVNERHRLKGEWFDMEPLYALQLLVKYFEWVLADLAEDREALGDFRKLIGLDAAWDIIHTAVSRGGQS